MPATDPATCEANAALTLPDQFTLLQQVGFVPPELTPAQVPADTAP